MEANSYATDHRMPELIGLGRSSGRPRRVKPHLRDEYVRTLATFSMFEGAPLAALRELAHECRDFGYPAGWAISHAQEKIEHVRLITAGSVRVDTPGGSPQEFTKGSVLGMHEFRTGATARARVVSTERVEGLAIPFDALRRFETRPTSAAARPTASRSLGWARLGRSPETT